MLLTRASVTVAILTGSAMVAPLACGRAVLDFPGDASDSGASPTDTRDGSTTPTSCAAGKTLCGSTCVDVTSDPLHCGGCDVRCDGQTPVCNVGECRPSCTGGRSACSGACIDLRSDPEHCGDCSFDCSNGACTRGECVCNTGQVLCGKRCVDTKNDRNNCGTCGRGCPASTVCNAGTCE